MFHAILQQVPNGVLISWYVLVTRLRVTPDETHILSLGTSKGGCVSPHRVYHCAQALLQVPDCSTGSQLPFGAASAAFPISGCSQSIRRNEHPCPNHNLIRVPRAYDDQSIHAQTIISFVFPEHTMTRASMPKP